MAEKPINSLIKDSKDELEQGGAKLKASVLENISNQPKRAEKSSPDWK